MNRKLYFITLAAASLFASACSNNEITSPATGEAIEFRAVIDKTDVTRASRVEKPEHLTSFFVAAGLKSTNSNYNLDFLQTAVWRTVEEPEVIVWNYAPTKYFPVDGTPVNFYAHAPIKDVNMMTEPDGTDLQIDQSTGKVSFRYAVPSDQSASNTAVDLLVSSASGSKGSGTVAFDFVHALSGVTFSAANNNTEGSELVYVIHEVEITKLAAEGVFTYPLNWDADTGTKENFSAGIPKSGVSVVRSQTSKLLSDNDIMMVLPQTFTSAPLLDGEPGDTEHAYVRINFSLSDGSGFPIYSKHDRYLAFPSNTFTFDAGTLYNFQFVFDELEAITFKVETLEAWNIPADTLLPN